MGYRYGRSHTLKLNWFSPIPNASTEIAQYTARLLPFLSRRADLAIYTAQSQWNVQNNPVISYTPESCPWRDLNGADANVFHIGNNSDFHSDTWEISRRQAGIVVLHDYVVQHLFAIHLAERTKRSDDYIELMRQWHGIAGAQAATEYLAGRLHLQEVALNFPLTAAVVANATGVMVHTKTSFDAIRKLTLAPVYYCPLPHQPAPTGTFERWTKTRARSREKIVRIAMFGYMGPNRRIEPFLAAMADLPERRDFRVDIYGSIWDRSRIETAIQSLSLDGMVRVRGYVDDLDARLAETDVAVNLRFPSMGEASAAQLRIWDQGLPSLVTDTGWYGELSSDAVLFVRPENEKQDIQQHLRTLLRDPELMVRMGTRGREILMREHSPETYVSALLNLINSSARFAPVLASFRLADRAAEQMRHFIHPHNRKLVRHVEGTLNSISTTCSALPEPVREDNGPE